MAGRKSAGRACMKAVDLRNSQTPKNVAPSGLPTWRSLWVSKPEMSVGATSCSSSDSGCSVSEDACMESGGWLRCSEVLRRKSWVTATPMEAKEREVRSQARKVRSVRPLDVKVKCWEMDEERHTQREMVSGHTALVL